jgi:hypothetical protein
MKFNELYTIEKHIIKFIQEKLGYEFIPAEEFSKLRAFENEFIITSHLLESVQKINGIDDTLAQSVVREIKKLDTNEAFLLAMRNGVNLKDPETGKNRDFQIVDFDNADNNRFVVTSQFYFEGTTENIRPDVMIFLNGLPISDIEAKSPTASSSVSFENAIDQIKRYEKVASKLFLPNCFNIATDGLKTVYGATYSPKQYFLTWREDPHSESKMFEDELDSTLYFLFEKERLLDVLKNFIVFEKKKEGSIKKIARYQQLYASNKIVERVKGGDHKKGLIWHTQGSGKTLTMFFTAWKLRYAPELKNPKVFILIDRIDLDDQVFEEFEAWGGQNLIRVESRKDLEKKIFESIDFYDPEDYPEAASITYAPASLPADHCEKGFTFDKNANKCVTLLQYCKNLSGSGATYNASDNTCGCAVGYLVDANNKCVYVPPAKTGYQVCADMNGTWDGYSKTSNGGYDCTCRSGYEPSANNATCVLSPVKSGYQVCREEYGSYATWDGYSKTPSGGYSCSCLSGYYFDESTNRCY